ncbi:hypothetical protein DPEC_G00165130 [Dallia pectoralis]|uniref:Uncharacterized protein n=1 Tax=Dallia pectoralis TaxID=75939 RepID=A0ACC2GHN3_DALPE|nr:hypothetical protein DPEC_G00165130 [Dallia pectoralis]
MSSLSIPCHVLSPGHRASEPTSPDHQTPVLYNIGPVHFPSVTSPLSWLPRQHEPAVSVISSAVWLPGHDTPNPGMAAVWPHHSCESLSSVVSACLSSCVRGGDEQTGAGESAQTRLLSFFV